MQIIFIAAVLVLWQILYNMKVWPKLLFPSVMDIKNALIEAVTSRGLIPMVLQSLKLLLQGLAIGIVAAVILSSLSVTSAVSTMGEQMSLNLSSMPWNL